MSTYQLTSNWWFGLVVWWFRGGEFPCIFYKNQGFKSQTNNWREAAPVVLYFSWFYVRIKFPGQAVQRSAFPAPLFRHSVIQQLVKVTCTRQCRQESPFFLLGQLGCLKLPCSHRTPIGSCLAPFQKHIWIRPQLGNGSLPTTSQLNRDPVLNLLSGGIGPQS